MMTLKTKIATAVAAVLLSTTLASAQAANPAVSVDAINSIDFSVTVTQTANIVVTQHQPLTDTTSNFVKTGTNFIGARAGDIEVETNLPAWDVLVTAKNGGKLENAGAWGQQSSFLQVAKSTGISDAIVRVWYCHEANTSVATTCTGSSTALQIIPAIGATGPVSLAKLVQSATQVNGFNASDVLGGTTADKHKATFRIFAGIDATIDELAGQGTYTEQLTATLVSWY